MRAPDERRFAATTNVRTHAPETRFEFRVEVVVSLVEADVLRAARAASCTQDDGVEREPDHPFVVNVGASQRDSNRDALGINQNVSFRA